MSIVEIKVPALGESVNEATVASWSKAVGDAVARDETLCELESDKATVEVPAEQAGTLIEITAPAGTVLKVGALLGKLDTSATAAGPAEAPAEAKPEVKPEAKAETEAKAEAKPEATAAAGYAAGHPSPAAAKLLREQGLEPGQVSGTGRGGRITKADVQAESPKPAPESVPAPAPPASVPKAATNTAQSDARPIRREKMSSLRRTVARRLVAVKNETAMLTTFNEVDMHEVMALRARYKEPFKQKYGVGLGFMSFFTAASCLALQDFPAVNAQISANGEEVVYHDYCDIGVAVSAPKGLVVPVLRNAEGLSFAEIEAEILRLAGKAREGKLSIDEMSGGTFTITNGGVFGSMLSTPILNAPQCAILGMHNIVERPVAIAGEVVIRPIMYLALSYDHRLIDGREAVGFLVRIKQLIEDPARLVLGV
ncbi:MAG TPA: 2-oxoglutarate dehydrogenase complex dihydrolipoyllysine-residue succinyltransferase [Candidatus Obscuribacterales bacterium]